MGADLFSEGRQITILTVTFPETDLQWTLVTTTASAAKDFTIKMNLLCKESLMGRMLCKKDPVLFLFPHKTWFGYLLELSQWGNSNKYLKRVTWSFDVIFMHNFSLTVTSSAKVLLHSNYDYNKFCCCIECRYKEGWLYYVFIVVCMPFCLY